MCGRLTNTMAPEEVFSQTGLNPPVDWSPRYNLAPSQNVLAIRASTRGQRELVKLRWGLLPSWAKEPSLANKLVMARAETLTSKPSFRDAFRKRRCAIVADGFFEWLRRGTVSTPFYFRFAQPLTIAGLWEHCRVDNETVETCCVVTTAANQVVGSVHERMPVLIDDAAVDVWLDADTPVEVLQRLLRPAPDAWLRPFAVSSAVNNPRNDHPDLLGDFEEEARAFGLRVSP